MRALVLKAGLALIFLIVSLRLVQIQVIQARIYQERARKQYEAKQDLPAQRGNIYDRTGRVIVANTQYVSFSADPVLVGDRIDEVAGRFARVFGKPQREYIERLSNERRHFTWLERRVNPTFEKQVKAEELPGVAVIPEPQRLYHYDHLAGQLLGFTDVDNKGVSGLEFQLDPLFAGTKGWVRLQRDGLNRRRPSVDYPRVEPIDGCSVYLTIDVEYQAIAEEELRKGVDRNRAESGLAIVIDPATGEILAMANTPPINPADPSHVDPALTRNRAVTDMFEPGSVFKIVTAAAALDHKLVKLSQKFFAEQGTYVIRLANGRIRNTITDTHKHGILTFQEAMEVSSNIVMAKVSDLIGAELFYSTARNFGFGTETGIELPGEVRGELKKPTQWSGTTLNSMAYGYEVGVTPLQILNAYAAVANRGILMKPSVLQKIVRPDNTIVEMTHPQLIRRVMSRSTAETLTQLLCGVVERGTGITAKFGGVSVAGKTGTARRVVNGQYLSGDYTASFVGFFPANNPLVACLVMIENPRDRGYTGNLVAAPVFKAIAEKIYAISSRFARNVEVANREHAAVPDVTTLNVDIATGLLHSAGFGVNTRGQGAIVLYQSPDPGTSTPKGTAVTLTCGDISSPAMRIAQVPDVRGLAIRRAVNRLEMQQLDVAIAGSGVVVLQEPQPGEQVRTGTKVLIRCEPRQVTTMN